MMSSCSRHAKLKVGGRGPRQAAHLPALGGVRGGAAGRWHWPASLPVLPKPLPVGAQQAPRPLPSRDPVFRRALHPSWTAGSNLVLTVILSHPSGLWRTGRAHTVGACRFSKYLGGPPLHTPGVRGTTHLPQ